MTAPTRPTASAHARRGAGGHRRDLDGLRGIAIVLVACFHIWFGRVSGGVDVFLTLSGYFFVGSLLRHTISSLNQQPSGWPQLLSAVNPGPRLVRLVRRLLPGLIVVLVAITVLTVEALPRTRWMPTFHEVVASALYYQNWFLALNSEDYAAASSANSPLQHLWSMSVQGQFFVVTLVSALALTGVLSGAAQLPVLQRFGVLRRESVIRAVVGVAIAAVAAVSFAWATHRMSINQPFNYYDTIARTWEPLAGGLLAVYTPRLRVPLALRTGMIAVALGVIVSCGFWIDGVDSYPGPWALVPVSATLIIIWAGAQAPDTAQRSPMTALLAGRVTVWLGSISYALYLWHWPLLIFYLAHRGIDHASFVEGLGILVVSIGAAWITTVCVEKPLRAPSSAAGSTGTHRARSSVRWRRAYPVLLTVCLVAATVTCGVGIRAWERHVDRIVVNTAALDPEVYPGARAFFDGVPVPRVDPVPEALAVVKDLPATVRDGNISNFTDPTIRVGVYGDPTATRTIALAGGSHAEYWITALDLIGKIQHFRVTTYLKFGCPLSSDPAPVVNGVPYPQCGDWVNRVMDRIIADRPDAVFTNTTRPRDGVVGEWVPPDYLPILDRFDRAGIPILGVRDSVWPHSATGPIDTPTCLAGGGTARSCGTTRASAYDEVNPTLALVSRFRMLKPIDLSNGWCDRSFCPAVVGNISVYRDWHHLSATFVRSLAPELQRQLRAALPWA
nr:acyltransferase family protein [Williamsia sp. CHRR-6]